jgi:hypothetical protein
VSGIGWSLLLSSAYAVAERMRASESGRIVLRMGPAFAVSLEECFMVNSGKSMKFSAVTH